MIPTENIIYTPPVRTCVIPHRYIQDMYDRLAAVHKMVWAAETAAGQHDHEAANKLMDEMNKLERLTR